MPTVAGAEQTGMATSVLDVRGTPAARRAPAPREAAPDAAPAPAPALRRVPLPALAAGVLGVVEGLGLLAVALTGLDGLVTAPSRPGTPVLVAVLLALGGWIVLAAGTGAALVDATGRRGFVGLAWAEVALVVLLVVAVLARAVPVPEPGVVALVGSLPVAKLLLAGAPSARRWVRQGPRVRETVPDPVAAHRLLAALTLGFIGTALVALTVLAPVDGEAADVGGTVSDVASRP